MKRASKFFQSIALIGTASSIGVLAFIPISASALGTTAATAAPKTSPFCTELPTKAAAVTTNLANLTSKVTAAWTQQDQKIAADEQKVDQEVAADRSAMDTKRAAEFAKLQAKATTPAEQTAVQTYISTIANLVTVRRAAFDTARQTYRSGLSGLLTSRRSTITGQLNTLKTSVSTALSTAETGCTSNPSNGPALRTALVASLASARQTYDAARKSDGTLSSQVQQLAATRNASFTAAQTTFTTAAKAAAQTLEQAFGSAKI